jgi:hypothetical protein
MDTTTLRINFEEIPWQPALPGSRFKLAVRGNQQLRLLEFAREFVEPDWCTKAHSGIVLEGELEIDFHGHTVRYVQGSGLFIPGGAASGHKARALTERARLLKNYCATLIRACAVLEILMYCSVYTPVPALRTHPAEGRSRRFSTACENG